MMNDLMQLLQGSIIGCLKFIPGFCLSRTVGVLKKKKAGLLSITFLGHAIFSPEIAN